MDGESPVLCRAVSGAWIFRGLSSRIRGLSELSGLSGEEAQRVSERKGGPHKKKRKTLHLSPESHKLLADYAMTKGLKMALILPMFIKKAVEHDIYDQNWIEKLKKAEANVNRYANLDGACPALAGGKKKSGDWLYRCVWFRPDSPPNIKNLGDSEDLQGGACLSCDGTKPYVEGIEERDVRIRELETELGSRSTAQLKVPKCNRGAVLNHDKDDQLIFTNCFRLRGEPVSVAKFCRIQARGLPCMFYADIVVGVEGPR